ncbi:phosphopyruvate hydratase [Candidatus Campbellbacteria bacterium CG22_combo_CG10-13_8_21_14_all_36_13]|uniref:Enolase n=1 Tax=Candidatus Campbellbacteria bacterium CG22_combo_CG10-13_8_21_14_all_36_13 TaxID=1974529 RepID=A0A2H0DYY9_9BACT|nr:MAG: phosphopyruvate hydratase [Candidatus Campbellbacteria bacterium CG22_combo_CG10-13_8_21_14_all_36_13]
MAIIENIKCSEIEDSRGNSTIRVVTTTDNGYEGVFEVPSGASTGSHEAIELKDSDGGMQSAIDVVENVLSPKLKGVSITEQRQIDEIMLEIDSTENKNIIGGNCTIGVSVSCLKAAATSEGLEIFEYLRELKQIEPSKALPYLFVNLINGGKHAKNGSDFQEHLIIPQTENPERAYQIAYIIQESLEEILIDSFKGIQIDKGDEGGFVFDVDSHEEAFSILKEAVDRAGIDEEVKLGTDVASSSFYNSGIYNVSDESLDSKEMYDLYKNLINKYGIWSFEDPFFEEDFESFRDFKNNNPNVLIIGDDLTVTNKSRIKNAIKNDSINTVIIKPNQIGTITETLDAMSIARDANIDLIVSHRSGETMDDFIADLAYAFGCFGLKSGAPRMPERDVKYQRLIEISRM